MKSYKILPVVGMSLLMSTVFAGEQGNYQNQSHNKHSTPYKKVVNYLDDSKITASVKSEIFKDPLLSSFKIGVETKKGKVHLSGITNTVLQFNRAISTAAKQNGVKLVVADKLRVRDSVTPHADMMISALAASEVEFYNEQYPEHAIDMGNIEAEVHNKRIYVHGLARTTQQKHTLVAILRSIDGNRGVYSALRTSR